MLRTANYHIIGVDHEKKTLTLKDIGPWNEFLTITNAAEWVVKDVLERGVLPDGYRLLYYDSDGDLAELIIHGGLFFDFGLFVQ